VAAPGFTIWVGGAAKPEHRRREDPGAIKGVETETPKALRREWNGEETILVLSVRHRTPLIVMSVVI